MITRAARSGVLKEIHEGHEERREQRQDESLQDAHGSVGIPSEPSAHIYARLDRVEMQASRFADERQGHSKVALLGGGILQSLRERSATGFSPDRRAERSVDWP